MTPPSPAAAVDTGTDTRPANRAATLTTALQAALPTIVAALVELYLLRAFAGGRLGWIGLAAAHAAVVTLLAGWTWQLARQTRDCGQALLGTIAIAAAGPMGGLAGLVGIALAVRRSDDPELLTAWYERIALATETDAVTRLCEQVASGRTSSLTGTAPHSFLAIMQSGTLHDRQAALGLVARNFHPDYLPVLTLALKSPEPTIRVQAAAVATRCRADLRALVDRHATAVGEPTPAAALAAAGELDAAISSGLLDEGDRIRAEVMAARLRTRGSAVAGPRALTPMPILARQATEAMLLRERRYGELRVARRIAAVAERAAGCRVRRLRRSAAEEAR